MMLLQLNPAIPVFAKKHGYGDAFIVADYGPDVNSVYYVRFSGGVIKHFYSDDILLVGNPMNGKGWDLEWPVRETSPEFEGPIERFPPGFREAMQDKFDRESAPEDVHEKIFGGHLKIEVDEEFPKGIQDPKSLQEAYEKALKDDTSVAKVDTSPRKVDTYNPERLPEDGGRNRKKWEEIRSMYASIGFLGWFGDFLDEEFEPPKSYHFDTWNKVHNWYVSMSQYRGYTFSHFLIEFYPAPDLKR